MIEEPLEAWLRSGLRIWAAASGVQGELPEPELLAPRQKEHGDFACNIALALAKHARVKPRELAENIVKALPASEKITQVEIAGPGFINFFLSADAYHTVVREILDQRGAYKAMTGKK